MAHRWHFFRAGGVDQVSLRDGADILALKELDKKLWVALAMPTTGVDIDPETLKLIDKDNDKRIRVVDILETVEWIGKTFKSVDDILKPADSVKLSALKDDAVVAAAKRVLSDLGKPDAKEVTIADANEITKVFANTVLNGDGIVIPESTDDADLKKLITDAIAAVGSVTDRSGKPGIDKAKADELFAAVDARSAWLTKGKDPALQPLGEATAAAHDSFAAVKDKLDDYFTRCRIAGYDARGTLALAGADTDLAALNAKALNAGDADLAKLPLAKVDPSARLAIEQGVNPAWSQRLSAFATSAVTPILGARPVLSSADVAAVSDRLAAYAGWRSEQPTTKADGFEVAWLDKLAQPELRGKLAALIEKDASLAAEYDQINAVTMAVHLQRDGARILRNFVNFSDFYSKQDGIFQAGTLYLDSRAYHLCVNVTDAAKHASLAASSCAYLIYVDLTRNGESKQVAVAITNGDADNIFVGRNGIFYDRANLDWDATIAKIVSNPISIREAFWTPYKKLVSAIEENVNKRAAAADAESTAKLQAAGKDIAHADKAALPPDAPPPPPPPPKKIDLGTVAAIGVAIGGIGTLVGALLATLFGLGKWLPIGIIAILLLISGPAMLLAWLKLRRRNLGPILDANGWAVNGRARVNVAFGAAMTELARLPKGSMRSMDDPFADKKTPWKRWVFLVVVIVLAATWYIGKLDKWLPEKIRSVTVLGIDAPAYKLKPPPEVPPPAPATGSGSAAKS
ncbi:MAG TPA: hypothetical protein VGM90_21500 [Kofleriaceae bacterium]|jgi:hypothetical protein